MKKTEKILHSILAINLILFFFLVLWSPKKATEEQVTGENSSNIGSTTNGNGTVLEQHFTVDMIINFAEVEQNYQGVRGPTEMIDHIKLLANEKLNIFYQGTRGKNIENYYQENFEEIESYFGTITVKEFQEILQELSIYSVEGISCKQVKVVPDSYQYGDNYDQFVLEFEYSNGSKMQLSLSYCNNEEEIPMIFRVVEGAE